MILINILWLTEIGHSYKKPSVSAIVDLISKRYLGVFATQKREHL